ncbi:MAG: 2-amino-4-hydroxy-6-hydroxymethyldihydropteridine diphosphokinase [Pseudomonadota bacterium]
MQSLHRVYIGLGTNLGDRIQNLIDAGEAIAAIPGTQNHRSSSFYVTSPVGFADQPDFINAVIQLDYPEDATSLFRHMQQIEHRMGRQRDPHNQNAPRVIDLDLLLFDDFSSSDPHLTLPHPRLSQRLFVLRPLLELSPGLTVPEIGPLSTVLEEGLACNKFAEQVVHKLG